MEDFKQMGKYTSIEKAWTFYDFGNSAYALLVMTLFYPIYFSEFVAPGPKSEAIWGGTVAISILLVGLLSPFLGAFSDNKSNRKSLFVFFSILSSIGTALLALTGSIGMQFGSLIFIAVNFSFGVSLFLYDSFLVIVPRDKKVSTTISGIGWAVGYIGGPLCLMFVWLILGQRLPENHSDYNLIFILTALFFLSCIVWPLKVLPRDKKNKDKSGNINFIKTVWETLRSSWQNKKIVFMFLIAMYFLMDGLTTIVYFISLFAKKELGFNISQIVTLLLIVQFAAIPFTILFCWIGEKKGEIPMLIVCSLIWCVIVALMYKNNDYAQYFYISALTGLVIGSTPALSRGFLSKIIPSEKRAELFGFNSFASRIATIIGPVLFGIFSVKFDMRIALLTVLPFFGIGLSILVRIYFIMKKQNAMVA